MAISPSRTGRPDAPSPNLATGSARRSSTVWNCPSSRTTAPISWLSISPNGCSRLARLIASLTCTGDKPSASRRCGCSRTCTTSSRTPARSTSLTPPILSSRSCRSSPSVLKAAGPASPYKATVNTGRSSTDTCSIIGFSASDGSSASASATVSRRRAIASPESALASNSTEIREKLSKDALLIAFTSASVVSSSSISCVTCSSIVVGSAPGQVVVMVACGMSRSGSDSLTRLK